MPQTVLRYPLKIFTEETDYLQVDVQEYVPVGGGRGFNADSDFDARVITSDPRDRFRRNSTKRPISTVLLPIPSTIQDGNAVSYNDDNLNSMTGAAVSGVSNLISGVSAAAEGGGDKLENAKNAAVSAIVNALSASGITGGIAQDLARKFISGEAVKIFGGNVTVQQLLQREQGELFNPNMELLFNGPTLRSFKFSFKMMPRNIDESQQVKNIIRTFKKGMSPKTKQSRAFLKTPNVFELRYRQGSTEHRFLNKFKQCFLQDISVNYTGEGNYATYEDGTPISMIMDLTFKELEPIYDIDYDDPDTNEPLDNTVGY
tara:strand:- start:466 stop:1413 length:948 start_codon:yes stop_codon:yes gene_type:complete